METDPDLPPPAITYSAENDAECAYCDDPISKGDEVRCYEDDGLVHAGCDSDALMWETVAAYPSWPA